MFAKPSLRLGFWLCPLLFWAPVAGVSSWLGKLGAEQMGPKVAAAIGIFSLVLPYAAWSWEWLDYRTVGEAGSSAAAKRACVLGVEAMLPNIKDYKLGVSGQKKVKMAKGSTSYSSGPAAEKAGKAGAKRRANKKKKLRDQAPLKSS